MQFFKDVNIQLQTKVYYNPNKPEICNGGKDWNDQCSYVSEFDSYCNLFKRKLKSETKGYLKSFKCKECLLNTNQLK